MEKTTEKLVLPLKKEDRKLLKERADYINQSNTEIQNRINSLFQNLEFTFNDQGDKQKTLFEIPFKAVTFHDLDDKSAYEKGGFVNFDVLGIHTIQVRYLESKGGSGYSAFGKLKINFLWNNLHGSKIKKSDIATPYYSGFEDEKLCFAETYVFQTQEQYELFKEIYKELGLLAKELGLSL